MKKINHSRKKRQLARIIEQLKLKISLSNQSVEEINQIKLRIKILLQELSGFVPKHQLIKILGSFAVVFGFASSSAAQSFIAPVQNPFGLTSTGSYIQFPALADLDGDGDIDMLVGTYADSLYFFENTGSAAAPSYAAPVAEPFGLSSGMLDVPAFTDLDGDGDLDLMLGQYSGTLTYHENVGSASTPSFAAGVSLPFGLTATDQFAIPEFADLDADGDMDLLVGEYEGNLQYFENTGTSTAPNFEAPQLNPLGLSAGYDISSPNFADFDLDGDLDMLLGEYYGNFSYFENTGTANSPNFASPQLNPFGLSATYYFAFPALADFDNDGDVDVMVSEYEGTFQYFENNDPNATLLENTMLGSIDPNPFYDVLNFKFDQDVIQANFMNLAGQTVLSIKNPKANVDVSSLDPGLYFVKCIHLNNRQSEHKLQKH